MRRFLQGIFTVVFVCTGILAEGQTNQTVYNGEQVQASVFPADGCAYKWTNDKPGIGLAASGVGNIPAFTGINNGTTDIVANIKATPILESYAYIANQNTGSMSVIDGVTHKVIATVGIGTTPVGVVASPDGKRVYVANNVDNTVSVINTSGNSKITDIPVGQNPFAVVVSPDSKWVYVGNESGASISVIDAQSNTVFTTVPNIQNPVSIAVSPDGKWVYAATESGTNAQVYVINALNNTVDSSIPIPYAQNVGMVIKPDGKTLYLTSNLNSVITVVNLVTKTTSTIDVNLRPDITPFASGPYGIAINSTGTRVYVICSYQNVIGVINTANNTVIKTIHVNGGEIFNVAISNDDKELYVVNRNANEVEVFNTANYTQITTITDASFSSPFSSGAFVSKGPGCGGSPINFTITVKPSVPTLTATAATGIISACEGSPSASPNIQQFTVSGSNLTGDITATAPVNFEVSLSANSGFGNSVILKQTGNKVTNVIVYVRSAASATGPISGDVKLSSAGAVDTKATVIGVVDATPVVNKPGDTQYANGDNTALVSFTGTGNTYTWTNDDPSIGLPANGTGDIASFKAINTGTTDKIATITITPFSTNACPGVPVKFTITVKAPPAITAGPVTGTITACAGSPSANPNIQQFTVSGSNLIGDITATAPVNFEVSLSANGGFGNGVILKQTSGKVTNIVVYVRSAASAAVGPIFDKVTLTSAGTTDVKVAVSGTVDALPIVDAVGDKTYTNGDITAAINFTGTGKTITWTNDTPAIGLASSGTGDLPSFTAINNTGGPVKATVTVMPQPSGYAYITNATDGTVSVINSTTKQVIKTITVGAGPSAVAVSPDNRYVYIVNNVSGSVSVIDVADNLVKATISMGLTSSPGFAVFSPDGKYIYVANDELGITVIDAATNTVKTNIYTGEHPLEAAITPDGKTLYVTAEPDGLFIVETATNKVNSITLDSPRGLLVSPDGKILYVSNLYGHSVSAINTSTNFVTKVIPVIDNPLDMAISSDGKTLYVANSVDNGVLSIINTTTYAVTNVAVGHRPTGVSITADDKYIYVTNYGSNDVSIIDAATNTVISTIAVGGGPYSMGNFITSGTGCGGIPITFTITVTALPPTITAGPITGTITACAGLPSASPDIQQFTVSGSNLTADIIATAPVNFEVSLSANSGFGNSVILKPTGNKVTNVTVYVRSAASATGPISGDVTLSSAGAPDVKAAVSGVVDTTPIVNKPGDTQYTNDDITALISFTGTGKSYTWTNDDPSIGLAATGAGDIPSFKAINTGTAAKKATITVTPQSKNSCSGVPVQFTITVNQLLPAAISTDQPLVGVSTTYGTPSAPTTFTVSGTNMRQGIKITPPIGIEVSSDGVNFSNTITVGAAGTIPSTTIYVRLAKTTPVGPPYGGSIELSSTGATTVSPQLPPCVVNPAPLTVRANNKNKDYGTLLTDLSGSADFTITGLQNSETAKTVTISYGSGAAANSPVGNYPGGVVPTAVTGGTFDLNNYIPVYLNGDITINKISLTIAADNKSRAFKDPNPPLTITYNGFVNSESPAQLTALPVIATAADETSLPGKYPIVVSGATSVNYDIAFINGILTITGVNVSLKIPNTFTPNGDGINDTWNILNIEDYPDCMVNIYNRWGQSVYSSVGYSKAWDGKYQGAILPVSTYYYIIDLKNGSKPYSGNITIVR